MSEDNPFEREAEWLRQPENRALLAAEYQDLPRSEAATRFAESQEFQALLNSVRPFCRTGSRLVEIGSGTGVAAVAWSRAGLRVTAVEPNEGALAGSAAIKDLAAACGETIRVVRGRAEELPFRDGAFDIAYSRAALHHMSDLSAACCEAARVLKPGGLFLATREHVISRQGDLPRFFMNHPTHWLTQCEMAHTESRYVDSFMQAGFARVESIGPLDSPINFYPLTEAEIAAMPERIAMKRLGRHLGSIIGRTIAWRRLWRARQQQAPGRLYSFLAFRADS